MTQPSLFPLPMPKAPPRPGPAATPARLQASVRGMLRRVEAVDIHRFITSSQPAHELEAAVRTLASTSARCSTTSRPGTAATAPSR